jgi:hypothetical protein
MFRPLTLVAFLALSICPSASAQITVGGFNAARSGCASITDGSCLDSLRGAISNAFPGTSFVGAPALSPEFLAGVDVLFITSAAGATTATAPLSSDEVAALQGFVARGGAAILAIDNDTFAGAGSDAVNESFVDWLGMDITGTGGRWPQAATTSSPASSHVANGPFGLVTNWTVGWTGWFNGVPSFAVVEAVIAQNGQPGLLSVPRHAIAACSGPVVVFGDTTTLSDGFVEGGSASATMILNAIAWATEGACAAGACGDIDGDGNVNASDLAVLLGAWGGSTSAADLDASGTVDASDLAILLGAWGSC